MDSMHPMPWNALALALGLTLSAGAQAQDHAHHKHLPSTQQAHAAPPATPPPAHADHAGHAAHAADTANKPAPPATPAMEHAHMGHATPKADAAGHFDMNHGAMDHGSMNHGSTDHAAMGHGAAGTSAQPLAPIPVVTDADRAAAFPELKLHMEHASEVNSLVMFNRLEGWDADHGSGQAWEAQAWIGTDLNRLWLRSEGERSDGHTESADLEVLYGRSVSAWWDVVGGIRHDFKPGGSQTWAAFGVQGLAPYKFEVQATAYVGESGKTAASIEAEYEVLLTNRLVLQPLVEVSLYGKDDPRRGIGSGLSTAEAGLRLRYEFTRRVAPYIGVVHERAFGRTADLRTAGGEATRDTRMVAGVRIWF